MLDGTGRKPWERFAFLTACGPNKLHMTIMIGAAFGKLVYIFSILPPWPLYKHTKKQFSKISWLMAKLVAKGSAQKNTKSGKLVSRYSACLLGLIYCCVETIFAPDFRSWLVLHVAVPSFIFGFYVAIMLALLPYTTMCPMHTCFSLSFRL